ncbi:hypothetical protein B9G98_00942 [Wickerhamiella sorbophila]|uniref:Major facilitator superfamily (MFS) profile domain-containing protein n=1 Tax=Wickerhamiella sorbophila TaxID=45607 RepID=A0A2T0FE86_9ASCO|nr:hypothetical protein B9G98_00942 [Wickerhamiella sorbophila]PRT53322.1 hypothetical protein B9G98_00942 [Wickerhamiella sorbophila]
MVIEKAVVQGDTVVDSQKCEFIRVTAAEAPSPSSRSLAEGTILYSDDLVMLVPGHPDYPLTWSTRKKVCHTMGFGIAAFGALFSGAVLTPSIPAMMDEFKVPHIVAVLAMSIYFIGSCLGPMIFAPVSEVYGRKKGVFVPYLLSAMLMCVVANLNNMPAVVVFRFLSGIFAAAPIVSSGGALADIWPAHQRAPAMALYSMCIIFGSSGSPIFGALLANTGSYGWRWASWLSGLLGITISMFNLIFLSETYLPTITCGHARHYRLLTRKWSLHSSHDELRLDLKELIEVHLARPFKLFLTPVVLLISLYASFVYGALFIVISSVGGLFHRTYDMSTKVSYLPLIANLVGFSAGCLLNVLSARRYVRLQEKLGRPPEPEERLITMMYVGWVMPAGTFLFAWTMNRNIHWMVPAIGVFFNGLGLACIFQGCLVYTVDAFTKYAASSIAANAFLRNVFAGVFPLFARIMFDKLGAGWGGSIIGCIGVVMLPIPWIFFHYGARLRRITPFKDSMGL